MAKEQNDNYIIHMCYICENTFTENIPHYAKKNLFICPNCLRDLSKFYISITTYIPQKYIIDDLFFNGIVKRYIPKNKREDLLRNAKCNFCGSIKNLEIDHIHPISKGGDNRISNLQVLCKKCNLKKSNKILNNGRLD